MSEEMMRNYKIKWGDYKKLIFLAGPIILSNFLQNLYNLADSYYMGKIGGVELATSSFTSPITQMIIGAGSGFAIGGGIIISQLVGKGRKKDVIKINSQLLSINLLASIAIMLLSFLFCKKILKVSGASGELLEKSGIYIRFIFLTIPFTFIISTYTTIKNSKGKSMYPLYLIATSTVANIVLNSIFVNRLKMGLYGIGIATLIANLLLGFYCIYELNKKREIRLVFFKIQKDIFLRIVRLGIPSSLTTITNSLSFIIINIFVVKYGTEVLAAYGVGNRINNIIYVLINGVGTAVAILVGQSVGSGDVPKAKAILRAGIILGLSIGTVSMIILFLILSPVVDLFTSDTEIKRYSINYLRIMLVSVIPWAIFQSIAAVFQGTGHTKFGMYSHFGRVWLFRVPFILFFERVMKINEFSIWYSMLFSNLFALVFAIALYRKVDWKKRV
ncbi:MATE family efflux transporter [uncultured Cetobacterium sp.]|uniref:MATE family efflux transporter n=1 Tax=uncultured Cetobacterium sp. TaxID=527638 RepID=UPI0025FABDA8|nr:MATE family efflux transporter [uncultured Cetobacterium sp.]